MRILVKWQPLLVAAIVLAGSGAQASRAVSLDAERSRVIVEVSKAGALSFVAGHSHKVEAPLRGTLSVDPEHPERASAAFEVRTGELVVMNEGEPPQDVPKVQETMASERVLDVSRYPAITFQSRTVKIAQKRRDMVELLVTGDLTLHGTTRSITVPVHADLAPGELTARGTFAVKQSDYGMKPVSVAGGMVSVKDEIRIRFAIAAGN